MNKSDKNRVNKVDETLMQSFPASDPPSWVAGREEEGQAKEESARVELDLNPDIVYAIIQKAREFHAQEGVDEEDEGSSFSDDPLQILAGYAGDLTYQEAKAAIDSLEIDQQIALVALMWLGRGDYTADEWQVCLDEARERHTDHTAEYLLSTPLVADYLQEGLSLLGYSSES